jgi:hypothetical protein
MSGCAQFNNLILSGQNESLLRCDGDQLGSSISSILVCNLEDPCTSNLIIEVRIACLNLCAVLVNKGYINIAICYLYVVSVLSIVVGQLSNNVCGIILGSFVNVRCCCSDCRSCVVLNCYSI